jgi:hypothetical protein
MEDHIIWKIIAGVLGGGFSLVGVLFSAHIHRKMKLEEKEWATIWTKHDELVIKVDGVKSLVDRLDGRFNDLREDHLSRIKISKCK